MHVKKIRTSLKYSTARCKTLRSFREVARSRPQCAVCDINFETIQLFEQHLQTKEHKMMDAPLEFILERMEESHRRGEPNEYLNLHPLKEESGESRRLSSSFNIDGLTIGAECLVPVEVSFCSACNAYIPREDPDSLRRHCMSVEHTNKLSRS